ncbi:hypothetical protein HFO24_05055 [Rhizobium laguerreae]|uniref:hypothetical protein n=1 Tax=Rhizobium laguerreae TaxID=1076926 RepID=UPI001C916DBB|nr:hypothetical protein [Rhizobium laguerreae]MBY3181040.1 hypothetical protein [Rhizobium laguerreae]
MSSTPTPSKVSVELTLRGGEKVRFETDPIEGLLAQLVEIFTGSVDIANRVLKVDVDGGESSLIFRTADLLSVKTTPPIVIESQQSAVPAVPQEQEYVPPPSWHYERDFLAAEAANLALQFFQKEVTPTISGVAPVHGRPLPLSSAVTKLSAAFGRLFRQALHTRMEYILSSCDIVLAAYKIHFEFTILRSGKYTSGDLVTCPKDRLLSVLNFLYIAKPSPGYHDDGFLRLLRGDAELLNGPLYFEAPLQDNTLMVFTVDAQPYIEISDEHALGVYLVRGSVTAPPQ